MQSGAGSGSSFVLSAVKSWTAGFEESGTHGLRTNGKIRKAVKAPGIGAADYRIPP